MTWTANRLARKMVLGLVALLGAISLLFLGLVVSLYRDQLIDAQSEVLEQVNGLLRVSLENAMLKRDLDGLRTIVRRLGDQPRIRSAMIVNPEREVRFAYRDEELGRVFLDQRAGECLDCLGDPNTLAPTTVFLRDADGNEILRNIVPVNNQDACVSCHGPVSEHPVNGVLVVDYDAESLKEGARASALVLGGSGAFVLLTAALAGFAFIRRSVLSPVAKLSDASRALAGGNLEARVNLSGGDELAELGVAFNRMADRLTDSLHKLEDRQAFLQAMIDAIPDGIRVIGRDGRLVMVNTAYAEQMGASAGSLVGTYCYAAHGRDEPCAATLITCPLANPPAAGETIKFIHHHRREDESPLVVEITAAAIETELGDVRGPLIIECVRDLEQQIKVSQEQRLAELDQLATGVAHEIYNPLASVRLGLQAILGKIEKGQADPVESSKYLRLVDEEVDKCIEVTRKLLALSTPPSKHLQLVSIADAIPDVLSLLRYEADRNGITVELDLSADPLRVFATETELRMLTLNLVQNAFHAMPDGGHLKIQGALEDGIVALRFQDSGVGMSPDQFPRIFDPFFSRRADGQNGTGLGLTICKSIVERYSGQISCDSTLGEGTTFTIRFPHADRQRKSA